MFVFSVFLKDINLLILFKQRKNKHFNYRSQHSKTEDSDLELTAAKKDEFTSKWERTRNANAHKTGVRVSMRTLMLLLIVLLICMYMLDKKFR